MHQVDLMVDARKQEWAKEKRTLQSKLDVREQEIIIHKATLAQKHNEVRAEVWSHMYILGE